MGKVWFGVACAIALVAGGCKDDGEGGNAGTGVMSGGIGGATGGVGGMGVTGGAAGMMGVTGGSAGVAGGMTGGAGGMGMTGGMGGVGGMGMTGGMGGSGGMEVTGGMGGSGGMEMTGGMGGGSGEVTDAASCIAAAAADGRTGACAECGCNKCLAEVMNCQDDACQSVVTCGQMAGCSGSACYCGDIDTITCVFQGAEGPCMNEIATASGLVGTTDTCTANNACASDLSMLADTDPSNPVQRARALSICTQGQRYAAATGLTEEVPEIMGMCETECAAE